MRGTLAPAKSILVHGHEYIISKASEHVSKQFVRQPNCNHLQLWNYARNKVTRHRTPKLPTTLKVVGSFNHTFLVVS
jgi:hypothetical protein